MIPGSPCRAEPSAIIDKIASGTVQSADTAQYTESNATSCAAMLRECRTHSGVRRRSHNSEHLASLTILIQIDKPVCLRPYVRAREPRACACVVCVRVRACVRLCACVRASVCTCVRG